MVSIMLLTTEEVLQRNTYWYGLDTVWFTEDMEPFEEIKQEHLFTKPLSRDYYYAKYPDIPRSESEDENSLSLRGFQCKHMEWKSKICVRKLDAWRRNSSQSYLNPKVRMCDSQNSETRRIASHNGNCSTEDSMRQTSLPSNNDERVVNFLKRLQENIPPPPIEDLLSSPDIRTGFIEFPKQYIDQYTDLSDIELPAYDDFENDKIQQIQRNILPVTSTLKNSKRKVSFNLCKSITEFESDESWNDSIYGAADLIFSTSHDDLLQAKESRNSDKDSDRMEHCPSWSEILSECDINDYSLLQSNESLFLSEQLISQSHTNMKIEDLESDESDNEEAGYARFAIYKIYQTLKIQGSNMLDSSSMNDLSYNNNFTNQSRPDSSFFGTVYRLAPSSVDS